MKTTFRFRLALFLCKCTQLFMRLLHRNATYFPGHLALKLCPDFLKYIARPKQIIAVTGTNGKTTVANLLVDILTARGVKVVDNRLGSNINAGIASALMSAATFSNRCTADVGVLEVDERSSIRVYPYIVPDYVIVTNLFRDSINRNAHPAFIASFINDYMPASTKLILNGNDLLTCSIAPKNARAHFGVELLDGETGRCESKMNDLPLCPNCRAHLVYDWKHYHHVGKAHCPSCGLRSPDCDYQVESADYENRTMVVSVHGEKQTYHIPGSTISDVYNAVAVIALLHEMGTPSAQVAEEISKINVMHSRHNEATAERGIRVISHMAKDLNAIACSRAFDYVRKEPGKKEVILMMYNRELVAGSSENIAWIYDSDFEFLNSPDITNIVIAGPRAADFKLRLLIAGVPEEKLQCVGHELQSPPYLRYEEGETVYILYGTDSIRESFELRDKIVRYVKEEVK